MHLGNFLRRLGRFDEAEVPYRAAVSAEPQDYAHRINVGSLLEHSLGRPEEAVEQYKAATEIDPDSDFIRSALIDVLLRLGRYDKVETVYSTAIRRHPEDALTHIRLC